RPERNGEVKKRKALTILVLSLLLVAALGAGVGIGAVRVAPLSLPRYLLHQIGFLSVTLPDQQDITIIVFLRLPRVLAAMLVGAALAVCGVVMQGLFRNPMASPEILGISAGGSLGAVAAITSGFASLSLFGLPL